MSGALVVRVDDPLRDDVHRLLEEHLADMFATSPAESVHALDAGALTKPSVTFWTVRDGARGSGEHGELLGCAALAQLDPTHGEVKSMHTAVAARGRGVAAAVLAVLVDEAVARRYARLSLETGTQDFFAPARRLYARHGFVECPPFADYLLDPNSVFMTREL